MLFLPFLYYKKLINKCEFHPELIRDLASFQFSGYAEYVDHCFNGTLVQANAANKEVRSLWLSLSAYVCCG